eukprot:s1252_g12.t1
MLQQVLGIAGSQMQVPRVSSRSSQSVGTWPIEAPRKAPGVLSPSEVAPHQAAERKGFFKWPMDIAEAAELARLRQAKAASRSA